MKKVLILFGGNSYEHEISCLSANFIQKYIDNKWFDCKFVGIDLDNKWYEINSNNKINIHWKNNIVKEINNIIKYLKNFDIVFSIIHGNTCEDGKLQSLFELYNIKYVGCDPYSSLICYDKLLTKLVLEKHDIMQIPYNIYNDKLNIELLDYPVIVKPCKCGSSIGISVARNKRELNKAIKIAKKYDEKIIIEKYITNKRELECAILENNNNLIILDIGEIMNNNSFYDFNLKYKVNTKTCISNIDKNIKKQIKNTSTQIFKILGCKGLARIDFFFDLDNKKLYFNEINTVPGFTKNSMYPLLIKNCGINYKKLITILLS